MVLAEKNRLKLRKNFRQICKSGRNILELVPGWIQDLDL